VWFFWTENILWRGCQNGKITQLEVLYFIYMTPPRKLWVSATTILGVVIKIYGFVINCCGDWNGLFTRLILLYFIYIVLCVFLAFQQPRLWDLWHIDMNGNLWVVHFGGVVHGTAINSAPKSCVNMVRITADFPPIYPFVTGYGAKVWTRLKVMVCYGLPRFLN